LYDINVLGAWLIEAYRGQFNNQISANGIDGLIKFLQDRNATLAKAK
jgi:phospholipid transport system substrate-binding protein